MAPSSPGWVLPRNFILSGPKRFPGKPLHPYQSWVLQPGSGPGGGPGLASLTPAHLPGLMVFPRFSGSPGSGSRSSLAASTATLGRFSWNWVEYGYAPLPGIEVQAINWVPDLRAACGEMLLSNQNQSPCRIRLDLQCRKPRGEPDFSLTPGRLKGRNLLVGNSEGQAVGLLLLGSRTTAAQASSNITADLTLPPGSSEKLRWIFATGANLEEVQACLRETLELDWAGEIAQLKVAHESQMRLATGNRGWDLVLAFSRKQALLALNQLLQAARSDPANRPALSPLQAWQLYLARAPLDQDQAAGLLALLFSERTGPNMSTPQPPRPGLPLPLIAELIWQIKADGCPSRIWEPYLPAVEEQLKDWLQGFTARDQGGEPGWASQELQPPAPELPASQPPPAGSPPILTGEHPGWIALLLNDCCRLAALREASREDAGPFPGEDLKQKLLASIRSSWSAAQHIFRSRGGATQLSGTGAEHLAALQPGWNTLRLDLPHPTRLGFLVQRLPGRDFPAALEIVLHGLDWEGRHRVERIPATALTWQGAEGWAQTGRSYTQLKYCKVVGLPPAGRIKVCLPPTEKLDISLLLALWAPVPDELAGDLIAHQLEEGAPFHCPTGLKSHPEADHPIVELPWNILAAWALLARGRKAQASGLISGWLDALQASLQASGHCYPAWHCSSGLRWGRKDWIESLFPVRLLLALAGVRVRDGGELQIDEQEGPALSLEISYRGARLEIRRGRLVIKRGGEKELVLSRSGEQVVQLSRPASANS